MTTNVESYDDNDDDIGPCGMAAMLNFFLEMLDLCISETAPWKKWKLDACQVLPMWNKCDVFMAS